MESIVTSYSKKFNITQLVVVLAGAIFCFYGSTYSFINHDVINPLRDLYLYLSVWVFSQIEPDKVLATHFSNPLDGEWIGNINLLVGCYAVTYIFVKCWINIAGKVFQKLEKKLFISKFGEKKYDAYNRCLNLRAKYIKKEIAEKNEFEKAQFEHYQSWTRHYKSSLSYEEWQEKVMNLTENRR